LSSTKRQILLTQYFFQGTYTMIRRFALASALFVAVGSAAPSMAVAGTASSTIDLSASVPNNCTISTSSLDFSDYNPTDVNATSDLYGTGTMTTTCTSGASPTITLSQGNNPGSGSTDASPSRRLAAGTNRLNYYLYKNSGRTTVWGNTTVTGLAPTADGTAQDSMVYATIPAGQNVPAGSYTDTVTATVNY
jgi:spore coat protein U-like protein